MYRLASVQILRYPDKSILTIRIKLCSGILSVTANQRPKTRGPKTESDSASLTLLLAQATKPSSDPDGRDLADEDRFSKRIVHKRE